MLALEHLRTLPFGEKLKYLRFINKMTQQEVADKIFITNMDGETKCISQPTYNRIEKESNTRAVSIDIIDQLERIFDLPKGALLDIQNKFEHLPKHLLDFVANPENLPLLEDIYIETEYKKRQRKS